MRTELQNYAVVTSNFLSYRYIFEEAKDALFVCMSVRNLKGKIREKPCQIELDAQGGEMVQK